MSMARSPSVLYARGVTDKSWDDDPAQRALLPSLDRIRSGLLVAQSGGWRRWLPRRSVRRWRRLLRTRRRRWSSSQSPSSSCCAITPISGA